MRTDATGRVAEGRMHSRASQGGSRLGEECGGRKMNSRKRPQGIESAAVVRMGAGLAMAAGSRGEGDRL